MSARRWIARVLGIRRIEPNEVGTPVNDCFDVGIEPVTNARDISDRRRILVPMSSSDYAVSCTDREQQFGGRRGQGYHASCRTRQSDVPSEIVDDIPGALGGAVTARNDPGRYDAPD